MKTVYASSEIAPFASTGALGEASGGLTRALADRGANLVRVLPMYRSVAEGGFDLTDTGVRLDIPVGMNSYRAEVWMAREPAPLTYFIRRDEFFDRTHLYGLPDRDYDDTFERFVFFQKAVVAMIDAMQEKPRLVHCNDWQTGLIPLFLQHGVHGAGRNRAEATLFTIHNLAFQGIYPGSQYGLTNLPFHSFSVDLVEFYGRINCLKAGMTTADCVSTVSPNYAREIRTEEYGYGLHGVLANLGDRLTGIGNGIDYRDWDPSSDPELAAHFAADQLIGKAKCRDALLTAFGLRADSRTPLIGMVVPLVDRRGLELLEEAMPDIMQRDVVFALLGSGPERYQAVTDQWSVKWPGRFAADLALDREMHHKLLAGADILLSPSRLEPCGMNAMLGLRYGAVPIVHAAGGARDIMPNADETDTSSVGFAFSTYTSEAMVSALDRAIERFSKPDAWKTMVQAGMRKNHSWTKAAAEYQAIYQNMGA